MNPFVTWRLAPGQRLLHRCWDGECVIYNDLSGDTHLLDEFTFELLRLLQALPRTAPDLAQALGLDAGDGECDAGLAPTDPDSARTPLAGMLDELTSLHLLEARAC